MTVSLFETLSFILRYWYILIGIVFTSGLLYVSIHEYRNRKQYIDELEKYVGYMEIVDGPDMTAGSKIVLTEDNTVGKSRNNDVIIDSGLVDKRHMRITLKDGIFYVTPHTGSSVLVDNRKVVRTTAVQSGGMIDINGITARLFLFDKDNEI